MRLVSGPGGGARKTRPPAARPECMPGGNRRPQPLPWQTVGAYPVALRFGRRGSNYVSVCGPAGELEGATRRGNAVRDVGPALSLRPRPREGGSAKAARRRRPGGVYPVALRSEGGRVIVVSLGPVGVCPSAVRPECVPGGNRRPQPLLRQPVRERTAVAHGADPSERSPAKIARRAWLLPSPSLSLRPERAEPLRPPLNLHTP